jgi:hypothetical protein
LFLFNCDHGRDHGAGYDRDHDHDAGYDRDHDHDAGYGYDEKYWHERWYQ